MSQRFFCGISVGKMQGTNFVHMNQSYDIVLTTYATLGKCWKSMSIEKRATRNPLGIPKELLTKEKRAPLFFGRRFHTVVYDESHTMSKVASNCTQAALNVQAHSVICSTGTVLTRDMEDVRTQLRLMGYADDPRTDLSKNMFSLTKKQAKLALKPVVRHVQLVEPNQTEATILRAGTKARRRIQYKLRKLKRQGHAETAEYERTLNRLRQCDTYLSMVTLAATDFGKYEKEAQLDGLINMFKLEDELKMAFYQKEEDLGHKSSKVQATLKVVEAINEACLIFSSYKCILHILKLLFEERKMHVFMMTGDTKSADRTRIISEVDMRARRGEKVVFLVTMGLGMGWTCNGLRNIVMLAPEWNKSSSDQSAARCHRVGQVQQVHIYDLHTTGSLEDTKAQSSKRKGSLLDSVVSKKKILSLAQEEKEMAEKKEADRKKTREVAERMKALFGDKQTDNTGNTKEEEEDLTDLFTT
jgi:hypothetical protein